ncbi:hypothetical protein C3941_05090 [Kaistia algarum]|uniref:autotransporter outer membrane beta-barrel domain-containing protein n=1 Tax=Kaistia algarum TaxID=2083279 RepID=UPI000CE8A4A6|nr:autotransporter domain-containing protein [Kaistia algarum]MCX5515943.1 autotransporter domain-containing protein [Kaistia algarum]PPE80694.1 hypothetical protein C3941_05090 [Kaistia algarum]
MYAISDRARRRALLAATAIAISPVAFAADTTIPNGTTRTTQLTISGIDKLTVDAGGAITTTSNPSVVLSGSGSNLTVDNSGTISSTVGRAIRTSGSSGSFSLTLTNQSGALIEGVDDAIGINRALAGGTVTITNDGTIRSTTSGQALDLNPATGGTVILNNNGLIEANGTSDVVRPGGNATITNYGTIQSMNDGVWNGTEWDRGDGIDFQSNGSGIVNNYGTIEAAKHGITGDTGTTAFQITNYADGLILGRNGSGINFDIPDGATPDQIAALSTAKIVNYGIIAGAAIHDSEHANADGDGVDIDYLANIENHGAILALGAVGDKDGNPDDPNIADAISIGGGTITNTAGALIYSVGRGILVDDSEGGAAYAGVTINNAGWIVSETGEAITVRGNNLNQIGNSGVIFGDIKTGGGVDWLTNSGLVFGSIDLGNGLSQVNNSGAITGSLSMGSGASFILNSGLVGGSVSLGLGSDQMTNEGLILGGVDLGADGGDSLNNRGVIVGSVIGDGWGTSVGNSGGIGGDVAIGSGTLANTGWIGGSVGLTGILTNSGWIGGNANVVAGTIDNSGSIGGDVGIQSGDGDLTNSGWIGGNVGFGSGNNDIDNSGSIVGNIIAGSGNDWFSNSGFIGGSVDLGSGSDYVDNDGSIGGGVAMGFGALDNAGSIGGSVSGSSYLTNYGLIGGGVAMLADTYTRMDNFGTIGGSVDLGNSGAWLNNFGSIGGDLSVSGSDAILYNIGWIGGSVATGVGNDFLFSLGIGGNVTMGDGADALLAAGTIGGNVSMGDGDDIVDLPDGPSVAGTLDGGTGFDSLSIWSSLSGVSTLKGVTNFETLGVYSGDWTFGDNEAYSAGVTVYSSASLAVNTALSAVTTVEGGATLSGGGSVSGLVTAGVGAVIVPGTGTSGQLTVNGSASLTDATLKVGMAGNGASNRLAVTGSAAINGGTVVLNLAPGPYVVGAKATVVSAAGGITGAGFSSLQAPSLLFITPTLDMDANTVTISLDRNGIPFASFAQTANERAVANALDQSHGGSQLYNYVASSQTSVGLAEGYDSLSGEIHADLAGTLFDQSMQTELTLLERLRQIGVPHKTAQPSQKLGYGEEAKPNSAAFDALEASGPRYSGWTQAFGSWLNRDGSDNGNTAATDSSVGGALVGADFSNDNYTFGLAGGYSWGSADTSKWSSSADIDTALIALYGGVAFDAVKLRGGASMGWSSIDTMRVASIAGILERPQANYNATTGNVFGEVAYDAKVGSATLSPYVGLGWVSVNADDFTETNAPLTGLSSSGASYETTYSTLGARFSSDIFLNGVRVTPRGMLGWRHAFDDVSPEAAMLFVNTGTGFTVAGTPIAQDSALVEAGADLAFNERVSLGFTYSGSFADNANSNTVKLTGEVRF